MSSPGIWRKVPGWLADPLGPLAIRWRYLPRLLPWLTRFLRAGATEARVAATARALRPLLLDAPELHRRLAEEAGVGELITRQGVLFVFPSRADFEAEELAWRLRRENGVRWLELSADELRQREPTLSRRYTFALLVEENGQCRDPGAYVAALVRHAVALGAELRRDRAVGFRIEGRRLHAVRTASGRDRRGSGGDRRGGVVAITLRGRQAIACRWRPNEAITPSSRDPGVAPRYPVMPSDGKMACVMTPQGLRLAGQVELAGLDAAPNWQRAAVCATLRGRCSPTCRRICRTRR